MSTPEPPPAPTPALPPPKPKMKLWKKILFISSGVVLGLILLVLAIGPMIIGSIAKSKITATLQEKLQASVSVGDVSFSWFGHVRIDDFRLIPKDFTEPLIEVKTVNVNFSLGSAMDGKYIADVEIVAPKILIERGADRKFNYEFPSGPPKERKARKKSKQPGEMDEDEEKEKGKLFVQASLKVRDGEARIRGRGRETVFPNVSVTAKVDTLEKPIAYDVELDRALTVKGSIDIDKISGPATLTFNSFSLKNLTGAARAYSDVAELDGTVTGSFDYQLQGLPALSGRGSLEIRNLVVDQLKLARVTLTHDADASGRQTLRLDAGRALAAKASAVVAREEARGDVKIESDLGELSRLLESKLGFKPDASIEGAAAVTGTFEMKGADSVRGRLLVEATEIATVDPATRKRTEIERALKLDLAGGWDGRTKTATAETLQLTSSFATMDGKGGVSLAAPISVKESLFQLKIDLEKLGTKLALFMKDPPKLTGAANASLTCAGDKISAVVSSAPVDLRVEGELRNGEGEVKIEGVARPAELAKLAPKVKLGGAEITLSSTVAFSPKGVNVAAQTSPIQWVEKGTAIRGSLDTQIRYLETGTTGTTKVLNLEVTDDKKHVIREPEVTVVHDVALADRNKTIDLLKVEVVSSFLKGSVTGKIRRDPGLELQKIHGAFTYVPEKLGAVVQPWLQGKLEGTEEKAIEITLDGNAASTDALALLRGTTGSIDLDLAQFTMGGLTLSGKTRFVLQGGKLTSGTPLEVNHGRSDLQALLDFNPPEKSPRSNLTFNAKDVGANGEMGPILERINPIFRTHGIDAKLDGRIQADFKGTWMGTIDPDEKNWSAAATKALSGGGTISVQNLTIVGSEAVGKILETIGQGNVLQGELVATQIRIEDGKCTYQNMTLRGGKKEPGVLQRDQAQLTADRRELEEEKPRLHGKEYAARLEEIKQREEDLPFRYTLRFTGWVKFDKTMQLKVQMPLTANMIKAHPHLKKYLGTSVDVDLHGSTDKPTLDVNKMLTTLAKRAAEGLLGEKATDLLGGVLKNKKRESEAEKLFNEAQKSEKEGNGARALELYNKVQNDYRDTEFFRKKKSSLEERISRLQGK